MSRQSFYRLTNPGAILADGPLIVPLFAVSSMSLSEAYHLPPLGSSADKVLVETHDDAISLSASLIGPDRFMWKFYLETLAAQSMRGSVLSQIPKGGVGGLILWSGMTIRTDIYVQSLTFNATSARQDVIEVSLTLAHLPRPGSLAIGLDMSAVAVATLIDAFA